MNDEEKKPPSALRDEADRRSARRLLLLGPTLVGSCVMLALLLAWCSAR
jgi:hypothetical protein